MLEPEPRPPLVLRLKPISDAEAGAEASFLHVVEHRAPPRAAASISVAKAQAKASFPMLSNMTSTLKFLRDSQCFAMMLGTYWFALKFH